MISDSSAMARIADSFMLPLAVRQNARSAARDSPLAVAPQAHRLRRRRSSSSHASMPLVYHEGDEPNVSAPRTLCVQQPATTESLACAPTVRTVHLAQIAMASKTCGAEEARSHLPELLEDAHQGSPTIITKRGRPYAALVPLTQSAAPAKGPSLLDLKGSGAGLWGRHSARAVARLREEWK